MAVMLASALAGCSTTQPTAARYRGDSVYGDDGKAQKNKKKKHRGRKDGKEEKGARPGAGAARPRVDPGLLARARGIASPMERALVEEAAGWIGTPYLYGGKTKEGADCSGLVMEVYRQVCGVKLPRSSAAQSMWCQPVAPEKMQPGDLVFFSADSMQVSHVGMFIGDGQMIHASSSRGVMVSPLNNPYWLSRFYSIWRVASAETAWLSRNKASDPAPVAHEKAPEQTVAHNQARPADAPDLSLLDMAISEKADSIFGSQSSH